MEANRFLGQARRVARCGASGKRRNAPEKPICPTEGRIIPPRGVVARLCRCAASPCEARLTTGRTNLGQMVLFGRIVL